MDITIDHILEHELLHEHKASDIKMASGQTVEAAVSGSSGNPYFQTPVGSVVLYPPNRELIVGERFLISESSTYPQWFDGNENKIATVLTIGGTFDGIVTQRPIYFGGFENNGEIELLNGEYASIPYVVELPFNMDSGSRVTATISETEATNIVLAELPTFEYTTPLDGMVVCTLDNRFIYIFNLDENIWKIYPYL
jgi:hypothetical protein